MVTLHKAQRTRAKLRVGLSGPSGSGKTISALRLAYGICGAWDKICIVDTENGSGELYSNHDTMVEGEKIHIGEYNVITLKEFKPSDYLAAIRAAEDAHMEVIIIDSITHEWKYILEAVDKMTNGAKNYTAWGKATPMHDMFVQSILKSTCHIITTVRSKQDYDMNKDEKTGKSTVTKLGLKPETREGFEYELTVSLDIDIKHNAMISKDRTGAFLNVYGTMPFLISEESGAALKAWYESGAEPVAEIPEEKKENTIVTLETPPSAPEPKHTPPPPPPAPPTEDMTLAIKANAQMELKKLWETIYDYQVLMGKNVKKDETKKMYTAINQMPFMEGRDIKQLFKLTRGEGVQVKALFDKWLVTMKEEYKKMPPKNDTPRVEETGSDTADMAREIFDGKDNTDLGAK